MKLMIVDDNKRMREMIRNVVAVPFDEICECSDGSEVVETYRTELPDLVLMDLHMETVGGIAATRDLLRNFPNAKVIIVSNFSEQEYIDEATEAGASAFFTKENLIAVRNFIRE